MYAVSTAFLAAVRQSHTIATRLDVCNVDGSVVDTIYPSGGEVTIDRRRSVRRECSFTVPDIDGTLTPASIADLLHPMSGRELRPYRGVAYQDGSTELVPLGVLPIRSAPASVGGDGVSVVTIGGQDRSTTVARNQWTSPFPVASGTTLEAAIGALLTSRAPQFPQNLPTTGYTLAKDYSFGLEPGSDPWADAQQMATDAGWELYFDATGTATMSQPADPTTATPVIAYSNDAASVTESAAKQWETDRAYNGVLVIGENSAGAVRALVWDDDPASPTYYLGDYGQYPKIIVSSKVATADQATAAATSELAKLRGVGQTVNWSQLVNPAHDVDDAIAFTHTDLRVSTALTVVLDSVTIPWTAEATMRAEARSRQVTA